MKRFLMLVPALMALGGILVGCSGSNPPSEPAAEVKQDQNRLKDLIAKSGGNWDALTPEEKQELIKSNGGEEGDEQMARSFFEMMAKQGTAR